jgi:hypothetical protein
MKTFFTLSFILWLCSPQVGAATLYASIAADTLTIHFAKGNQYCMQPPHTPCLGGPQAITAGENADDSVGFLAKMYFDRNDKIIMEVFSVRATQVVAELDSGKFRLDEEVPLLASLLEPMGKQHQPFSLKEGLHPVEKLPNGNYQIVFR